MSEYFGSFPKIDLQLSPPYTAEDAARQILSAVQHNDYETPIIYLEVLESGLAYPWEDLTSDEGPLFLQYPLYVYANKVAPLPPRGMPLRILFTTPAQVSGIEQDIFAQLRKECRGWVDPIVELNCQRRRLIDRLREKPVHVWHHQGATLQDDHIWIELADGSIPIQPLLKKHAAANTVLLQTRQTIQDIGEIPLLLTLSMGLSSKQTKVLLSGFYRRLLTRPLEVAVFLSRLDAYIEDHTSSAWKDFKLRGCSPSTELFAPEHRTLPWLKEAGTTRVLFLKANPSDTSKLDIDHEFKFVRDCPDIIRSNAFDFVLEPAVCTWEISGLLEKHQPEIVHFSGHGSKDGFLKFEGDEDGRSSDPISGEALSAILQHHVPPLKCIVLNSCWSEQIARSVANHIECVVGMRTGISDYGAKHFSRQFYLALANGNSVGRSFIHARDYLLAASDKTGLANENLVPKLLSRTDSDPDRLFFVR